MAELRLTPPSKPPASDRLRGEVLGGRFELIDRVDEGGMAFVYAALDRTSGEHVAVKVLRDEHAASEELRQRFFYEAEATMGMVSKHVVEIVDLGAFDGEHAYFAMEMLHGLRLDELCGEQLPFELVYDYARQIASGLEVAHGKGVVHRDLKPDNIFVERIDDEDVVKLIDFGIAKHETASTLTVPGSVFGTPHYMAPEQAAGRQQIGPHTDVYALGVILYELVAGEMPFDGMDAMQVMLAQIGLPPPSLRERRPDCPEALEALILRCLEKRPTDRYATVTELRAALDELAGDTPTAAEAQAIGEDISGLRLRPHVPGETPEIDVQPLELAELMSRPTPTDPTPWAQPTVPSPAAPSRAEWRRALAIAVAIILLAYGLGATFL